MESLYFVVGKNETEVGGGFGEWGEGWIEEEGPKNFAKKLNMSIKSRCLERWRGRSRKRKWLSSR